MLNNLKLLYTKYENLSLVKKATLWFLLCSIIQKCISVLSTPIFTRLLSEEQYGQYSLYLSWIQIITIFTVLKLDCGVFNKGMSKYDDRETFTATMQSIVVVLNSIGLIIYLIFRNFINSITELSTLEMVCIFIQIYFQSAIAFWSIKERYNYRYKSVVFATILMSILNIGLGIILVLISDEKGFARIVSCVVAYVCVGTCIFFVNYRKARKMFDVEQAKYSLKFNLPLIPHYLSTYILEQSDRIMIQKLVGFAATGLYSVAYSAGMVLKLVTESFNNAFIPWQYQMLQKGKYKEIDETISKLMYIITAILVLFMFFAPECMRILASPEYYEAVYVIPPVAGSILFLFIYGMYGNAEFFYEENKFIFIISLLGAIVNIGTNYIFIKIFGYVAAGYTTFVCYMIFSYGHLIFVNHVSTNRTGEKIFSAKPLNVCTTILICACVGASILYNKRISIRYIILAIFGIAIFIKRKTIIDVFKNINKARK